MPDLITSFFLLILLVLIFFSLSIIIWTLINGISPMPSSYKAQRLLKKILPELQRGNIYELGSGWGTLLILLAQHYETHQIIGFETSWVPYFVGKLRIVCKGLKNVLTYRRNFFQQSLQDPGLIICYLYPQAMAKIALKLEEELKNDVWVISLVFAIPHWDPVAIYEINDIYHSKIYVYYRKK